MDLPKNYDPKVSEPKWQKFWIESGVFKFYPESDKEVYSIDTPPPTVSGKMHLGHSFSYSQQDFIARYKRMRGFNVFYPFGTDDNGLATERLIEKMKKVKATKMERADFVKLCLETLETELRQKYIQDWKNIGMSCDWDIFYTTINQHSQKVSQKAFLDLVKKERVYRKKSPVMWDPMLQTALSQVELEDKEVASTFNDISFKTREGELIAIATTRPELLCSCVAVIYHPEDERYQKLKGQELIVPVYHHAVPVLEDKRVDPEKGTGIVMCCTFGDMTDAEWQKAFNLPIKEGIGKDGKMTSLAGKYEGMSVEECRKAILEDMKESGELISQRDIMHVVNVGERSGAVIEFINSEQWFVKYLDLRETFLQRGEQLNWYPKHMKNRYDNWVKGLQWDWCISRQRYFGVPFPVWYDKKTGEPIFASEEDLPVDPLKDLPKGYSADDVIPEKDVMDTWATSSLTPHLAADLFIDHPIYKKILPMDLRPQAHDIITFWLFNTVVRSHLHRNELPWKDVMISGWALDPKGKKMSKSKGNVVEPQVMIEKFSADALRFWAAGSRLGDDLPFQEKDLVTGVKFATKLWNASKFCFMHLEDFDLGKHELETMDKWILSKLSKLIVESTESMEKYEYSKTKLGVEHFFWHKFCDNYLEIVKDRLYNPDVRGKDKRSSGQYGLYHTLLSVLKLLAPIMPYITEEVYQIYFASKEGKKSVHISNWPKPFFEDEESEMIGDYFLEVVEHVRRAKSEKSVSLKTPVKQLFLKGKMSEEQFSRIRTELMAVTKAEIVEYEVLDEKSSIAFGCELEL